MPSARYQGARGSNAGDDYHELWVLLKALTLLDQSSDLQAIEVEGVFAETSPGVEPDAWDGVDCTFYYSGDSVNDAHRIVFDQVKYSSANPESNWVVSRLTDGKQVFKKLARIFKEMNDFRPDLIASNNLNIRLVSNQAVGPSVIDALEGKGTRGPTNYKILQNASGLNNKDFELFLKCLDLSYTGGESRAALEQRVMETISAWTDEDAMIQVNNLRHQVRRLMMPEHAGDLITKGTILSWLGLSAEEVLFPCPSAIEHIDDDKLISRISSKQIVERMIKGHKRLYLHGPGGCGKTTTLQEIQKLLPLESEIIIFDCYGGGKYLDPSAQRHRSQDAFLQLSNELAIKLQTTRLLTQSPSLDFSKSFKRRLYSASEIVAARSKDALLAIVVDAGDNSVTAAEQASSGPSFVHDFAKLRDLPANVRFLITTRTGRKDSLELPPSFEEVEITGFNLDETRLHVQSVWSDVTEEWIEDFKHLSQGNPRVQQYAIENSAGVQSRALENLRPAGKQVQDIFNNQLGQARDKGASEQDLASLSAGLISLPRPIPIDVLSKVSSIAEDQIIDLCNDMTPGLRLQEGLIGFADEDFEQFIRDLAEPELDNIHSKNADVFWDDYPTTAYASTNVAQALYQANRYAEVLDLIEAEPEPNAITDPVLRRTTQMHRLAIAMKVCRQTKSNVDAILTLLRGAEALKTDKVIQDTLADNPDLASSFSRSTVSRTILGNSDRYKHHGPLLFHLAAEYARRNDGVSVREHFRMLNAWLKRRDAAGEGQRSEHRQLWDISTDDLAAETEAVLLTSGPADAIKSIRRWRPRSSAFVVASILSKRLIKMGKEEIVEMCLREPTLQSPWDIFLLVPLALSGRKVDEKRLSKSLNMLHRRNLIKYENYRSIEREETHPDYLETILSASEIAIAQGVDLVEITPTLEALANPSLREWNALYTNQTGLLDLQLRAHALLQNIDGKELTLESFLVEPSSPAQELSDKEINERERRSNQNKKELQEFLKPLVEFYNVRAKAIAGESTSGTIIQDLKKAIKNYERKQYSLRGDYWAGGLKRRAAISISRLISVKTINVGDLLVCATDLLDYAVDSLALGDVNIYEEFGLHASMHEAIQQAATERSKAIKQAKTSADEKISALLRFARLLFPISRNDAEAVFKDLLDVANDINVDAFRELELIQSFSNRAVVNMTPDKRKEIAICLAKIISDVSVRLQGYDGFPWDSVSYSLATLDLNVAFAAAARWEDEDISQRRNLLPGILNAAVKHKSLPATQIASLSPLIDFLDNQTLMTMVENALTDQEGESLQIFAEQLAKEELLLWSKGKHKGFYETLGKLPKKCLDGFWCHHLRLATTFHQTLPENSQDNTQSLPSRSSYSEPDADEPLVRLSSQEEAHQGIARVEEDSDLDHQSRERHFETFANSLHIASRIHFLEALCEFNDYSYKAHERSQLLMKMVSKWSGGAAVDAWCKNRLPEILKTHLPAFCRYYSLGESSLSELIQSTKLSEVEITELLIEGIESNIDNLNSEILLSLIGYLGNDVPQGDAEQITIRYSERLIARIPKEDLEQWDLIDIPWNIDESIARYLYALMSDVDQRIRWRAAHCLRNLACMDAREIISEIISLYDKRNEKSFRNPDKPFYWLSARLWLMIALHKIAIETPTAIQKHVEWIKSIIKDVDFPHLLIRKFALEIVETLADKGHISIQSKTLQSLQKSIDPLSRESRVRDEYSVGFDRYAFSKLKERRFHFNSMDTLPYWYNEALRTFADVSEEDFLDTAEKWIVDQWAVKDNPWEWNAEPRKTRLTDSQYQLMGHRHGSLPILERFSTYLEWNAMWCTVGELMQIHALAKSEHDDIQHDTFEDWLGRNSLSIPPLWLADLHLPKPLEKRLWLIPEGDIDEWADNPALEDFSNELFPELSKNRVVVAGHHNTYSSEFTLECHVRTALVSPETAGSLLRALQTTQNVWDYILPLADQKADIDEPPFLLKGWLVSNDNNGGIDENDSKRFTMDRIKRMPADETNKALNLIYQFQNQPLWLNEESTPVFAYLSWSDLEEQRNDSRARYTGEVISQGWRLQMDVKTLKQFLIDLELDLVIQIEIRRRNMGYGEYSRFDEEKQKEFDYDRVLLLRRDGAIEGVEGSLGSWAPSGS